MHPNLGCVRLRPMKRRQAPVPSIADLLASERLLRSGPSQPGALPAKALLASPSPYAVAMGGLSLQSVWESLRDTGLLECDRAFSEAPDGPALLPKVDLRAYDLIGLSLPFELEWLNVPAMLSEGGLPVWSRDRGEDCPFVIAGGASVTMNPEPLAEVVDAFVIGELEPIAERLAEVVAEFGRYSARDREACLDALTGMPGVYVPSRAPERPVERLVWDGLTDAPRCSVALSPHTTFPNRFLLEVGRGCPGGCRYCLSRSIYRPVRYATREALTAAARQALPATRHIGLIGASLSGYPQLGDLVEEFVGMGAEVSLASLRADKITPPLLQALRLGGQETITVAPEAGSEPLRRAIGKPIGDEQLLAAVAAAERAGLRDVRLYFMTSLPGETAEDAEAAVGMVESYVAQFPGLRVGVTLSPFIPKPWTPFEGETFPGARAVREGLDRVASTLRARTKVKVRAGSARWAAVQAALARGGREIGPVLVVAAEEGGGYSAMKRGLRAEGIDLDGPLHAPDDMPWRRTLDATAVCSARQA